MGKTHLIGERFKWNNNSHIALGDGHPGSIMLSAVQLELRGLACICLRFFFYFHYVKYAELVFVVPL